MGKDDSSENEAFESHQHDTASIAGRLRDLKNSAVEAAAKRERLPRKLFWSLFRAELDTIKRERVSAAKEPSPRAKRSPGSLKLVHNKSVKTEED